MTPQERPEPGRTRREGNVVRIQTEFASRLRFLVLWEMRQQARQAVIRKIKAEGKAKVSLMSAGEITRLAMDHLRAHSAELLAAAEASGTVQNLRLEHERRVVDAQRKSLCECHDQNGAQQ